LKICDKIYSIFKEKTRSRENISSAPIQFNICNSNKNRINSNSDKKDISFQFKRFDLGNIKSNINHPYQNNHNRINNLNSKFKRAKIDINKISSQNN
jgi:hypothetical protein